MPNFQGTPARRQDLLLGYLREVAKDLMVRGIIRRQQGVTVVDILKQEPAAVVGSIVRDLRDAGLSLKMEILGAIGKVILGID